MLAHELVHAKFDEIRKPCLNIIVLPGLSLEYALTELRANTIAYELLGQDRKNLEDYFLNFYPTQNNKRIHVNGGYVSGESNLELIMKNPIWNEQAIDDAIEYFTKKFRLNFLLLSNERKEKVRGKFKQEIFKIAR